MQLEDPHVPKDVVEGQARIRVGLWTEFYDQASTHQVFRAIKMKEDTMATYGSIDNMSRIGLAAERNQARSQDEDEGRLRRQIFDAVDKGSAASAFIHCSRTDWGARSSNSG